MGFYWYVFISSFFSRFSHRCSIILPPAHASKDKDNARWFRCGRGDFLINPPNAFPERGKGGCTHDNTAATFVLNEQGLTGVLSNSSNEKAKKKNPPRSGSPPRAFAVLNASFCSSETHENTTETAVRSGKNRTVRKLQKSAHGDLMV